MDWEIIGAIAMLVFVSVADGFIISWGFNRWTGRIKKVGLALAGIATVACLGVAVHDFVALWPDDILAHPFLCGAILIFELSPAIGAIVGSYLALRGVSYD